MAGEFAFYSTSFTTERINFAENQYKLVYGMIIEYGSDLYLMIDDAIKKDDRIQVSSLDTKKTLDFLHLSSKMFDEHDWKNYIETDLVHTGYGSDTIEPKKLVTFIANGKDRNGREAMFFVKFVLG